MRGLEIQKQNVWFVEKTTDDSMYEATITYSKPVKKRVSVSATASMPDENYAGTVPSYDRYITCFDIKFSPKEGTLLYVDAEPELSEDGSLVLDESGNPKTENDYVLVSRMDTKKGTTAKYGIKKKSEDN